MYYYGARYYTPWIARFISCDPLSAQYAQLSPYNYSDNNPINDYDIDGMQNNNTEGSEQGGAPPPNTIEIDISKDIRNGMSAYLPKTAADGQRIDLVDPDSSLKNLRYTNIYDSEKGMWKTTMEYEGQLNPDNGTWFEGWAEESINELSLKFSGNSPTATVIEKVAEVAEKVVETTKEVVKTVDKVISNKTVGDVVSGGGLASSMIDVSAYLARKDVVKAQKKTVRAAQKLKINTAGKLKDKGSKTLKKIGKTFSFVGRVLGITSAINNFSNAKKEWDKGDKGNQVKAVWSFVKGVVDIGLSLLKMNPVVGFAVGFAWSLISAW